MHVVLLEKMTHPRSKRIAITFLAKLREKLFPEGSRNSLGRYRVQTSIAIGKDWTSCLENYEDIFRRISVACFLPSSDGSRSLAVGTLRQMAFRLRDQREINSKTEQ